MLAFLPVSKARTNKFDIFRQCTYIFYFHTYMYIHKRAGCLLLLVLCFICSYFSILHFTFLVSLFVFVSAAGHYFRIWTGSIWTCIIILDKKYNIANSSCHFGSYGSIWTGPSPKKYYMDLSHMTLSAMNYLLYIFIFYIIYVCVILSLSYPLHIPKCF